MKRKHRAPAAAADAEPDEPSQPSLPLESFSGDVCAALTARYGRSAAPQHRHLLASAAAIQSILLDDGLPLTPASYIPAVVSALRAAGAADPDAASALASLLVILLPHIPSSPSSLQPAVASESSSALAAFLSSTDASQLPTGTLRSVVKSLGHLVLHLDPAADWDAVVKPLQALLASSVDHRAKVRKCAQDCAEKLFSYLEQSGCAKKASKVAIGMFEKHISSAQSLVNSYSDFPEGKETQATHMLGAMILLVPYLSKKARKRVFSGAYLLLSPCFSPLTRHVLRLLETLLDQLKAESVESEVESLLSLVIAYLPYDDKKPDDTIVSALHLFKSCLAKLVDQPKLWIKTLPPAFEAVSGYLVSDRKCSDDIAKVLIDCIDYHVDQNVFATNESQLTDCDVEGLSDQAAMKSICVSINNRIHTCAQPPDSILTIILVLFLKLGESSFVFMKDTLLTLSQFAMERDKESHVKNIEECVGAAVVAMGPEKVLSLLPVSFDKDKLTCSNTWLLPILDKYVYGAKLQLFLEHILPLARSVKKTCKRVKNARIRKDLLSWTDQLWNLLPAFCRYPIDVHHSFASLSKLLVEMLKCDERLHKHVAKALQQLVDGTRRLSNEDGVEIHMELSALFSSKPKKFNCARLERCSKKDACKTMKVLASHSANLLCTSADYFLESSPEKRANLMDALRCLALLSSSASIRGLFVSLVKRFDLEDNPLDPEIIECQANEVDGKDIKSADAAESIECQANEINGKDKKSTDAAESVECQANEVDGNNKKSTDAAEMINDKRSVVLELISALAEAADEDLLDIFFEFIRASLENSSGSCDSKALIALSAILKEHNGYSLARLDEMMMLLHGVKPDLDNAVLESQLLCYQYLLLQMIKVNEESTDKKAFLVLNELILRLKTKKESRKLAYDVLLAISSSLRSSESNSADSGLQRLFTMVMGYLSSSSPHILSGAIAALSLLIYNDANFCMEVPNLIPSVLVLLQHKAIEVTKASLGFVKVLVTSLQSEKLLNLQSGILSGILPWSLVSKHHFKAKVALILEILIRKCGFDAVNLNTPEKFKAFIRSVEQGRKGNRKGNHDQAEGTGSEARGHAQHDAKRRKRVDSGAESEQKEKPRQAPSKGSSAEKKQTKEFHIKRRSGRSNYPVAKSLRSKASNGKDDRPNFKSKSKWQPENGQRNKGDKSPGSNKRTRDGTFSKTQDRGSKAPVHSRSFKKLKSEATA